MDEIKENRNYLVVKGNELIQKNRFELSLPEQKTIAFICSMIKPSEHITSYQLAYEFNIRDYCKICGLDYNNGKNYADIKNVLKKLSDRSMWLEDDNEEVLVRWLSKVRINKRKGNVVIEIDKDLAPFLFNLGQKFTQYELYNVLAMKSAFSVRIYEILKSYAYQKSKIFDLDHLKNLLMVQDVKSYIRFPDFRRYVLEKAQQEINEMSDLNVTYEPIKRGNKVVKIKFIIELKKPIERMMVNQIVNNKLNYIS